MEKTIGEISVGQAGGQGVPRWRLWDASHIIVFIWSRI